MSARRISLEMQVEEALVRFLSGSVGSGITLARFEELAGDAEPPIVSVKVERQEEISSGTGVWEMDAIITGRDVRDEDWAPIEDRILDTTELKEALNTESMATVDGQAVDYSEPSEREVDEEYQRVFPIKIFTALTC